MFRAIQNNKIGNVLIYFSEKASPLSLTKALKLLYILDETSVQETGVPVTWLDYQVWERGPVAKEIYLELRNGYKELINDKVISLDDYIKIEDDGVYNGINSTKISPLMAFNDDEFSDYEIELLEKIVKKFGNWSATDLVNYTHRKGSLWAKIVDKFGLEKKFAITRSSTTYPIDFLELLEEEGEKLTAFQSAFQSLSFQENILSPNRIEA